jgi:AcrR family transcriptional regulator
MNTRDRILETASRLFYTQGYNNTGINQVIKEAEAAKASLYQYFPSKDDLLLEYLSLTSHYTMDALRKVASKYDGPKEKVLSLFDFLIDFSRQTDYQGCNFLNIASEIPRENSKVRALIQNQKTQTKNLFAELLSPMAKESLADEMYLLFDGALITSKVYGDIWPILTSKKIAEKLL